MSTELAKINPTELDEVIISSGLAIQEGEAAKQSYLPYLIQLSEIQEQSGKINYENPTAIDEKIARELRLSTVKIRTGAMTLKDERKKIHILKGNLEQASYNVIAASCKLAEETFASVEKASEMAEKKRIEALEAERHEKISQFTEIIPAGLGLMGDDVFEYYLNAAELTHKAKIESDRIAEETRIAKELQDAKDAEIAAQLAAKEKDDALAKQVELQAELDKQAAIAAEKERQLEVERKAAAELLRVEQEKANAILMAEEAKQIAYEQQVAKDAKIMNDAIAAEKAKSAKLEAEIKAAKEIEDAKLKAIKDAEDAKEESERIASEAALKAPRKQKLVSWTATLAIPIPVGMEKDEVVLDIMSKFNGFKKWAENEINKL